MKPTTRIKVLPLESWLINTEITKEEVLEGTMKFVAPRFNRPGMYLVGDECWAELESGHAIAYNRESFLFNLRVFQALELDSRQAAALKAIIEARLATNGQRDLYYHYRSGMEARDVGRRTQLYMIKNGFFARRKAFKARAAAQKQK